MPCRDGKVQIPPRCYQHHRAKKMPGALDCTPGTINSGTAVLISCGCP
jgi:hypothetical protein